MKDYKSKLYAFRVYKKKWQYENVAKSKNKLLKYQRKNSKRYMKWLKVKNEGESKTNHSSHSSDLVEDTRDVVSV